MSEKNSELNTPVDWEEIQKFTFSYLKIIGFSFILPMWIAIFINEGAVLWKVVSWAQNDIMFWENNRHFKFSLFIFLIPLVYLAWFYYLTIKNVFIKIHKDFFRK